MPQKDTATKDGGICIYRYNLDSMEVEEFGLDPEEAYKFEEVTLERVKLGCGQQEGQLFLHDLTMVTGQIPFWRISLHPETVGWLVGSPRRIALFSRYFPVFR